MARHRRWPLALAVPGLVLGLSSFAWQGMAPDRLVKLPDDLDMTATYEGTITLYVDPASKVPLAEPDVRPLDITRTVKVVEASSALVVVRETVNVVSPDLFDSVQEHQYVMDRRTAQNVADPRAYAFEPDNVVDRSGTFRIFFPFDTDTTKAHPVWKDEMDLSYEARPTGRTVRAGEVDAAVFAASMDWTPVTDAFVASLSKAVALPSELGLDQLKPLLAGKGLDIDATLAVLLPQLSPDDLKTLVEAATSPIELVYVDSFEGETAIEPVTGSPVDVLRVRESIGATPAPEAVAPIIELLRRYPEVPEAGTLADALEQVSSSPIELFTYDYAQTEASVAESSAKAADGKQMIRLVRTVIPWVLLAVGGLLALVGVVLWALPKRSGPAAGGPGPAPEEPALRAKAPEPT